MLLGIESLVFFFALLLTSASSQNQIASLRRSDELKDLSNAGRQANHTTCIYLRVDSKGDRKKSCLCRLRGGGIIELNAESCSDLNITYVKGLLTNHGNSAEAEMREEKSSSIDAPLPGESFSSLRHRKLQDPGTDTESDAPTRQPSSQPSNPPTEAPVSSSPSSPPTRAPTPPPTSAPSSRPSALPTRSPVVVTPLPTTPRPTTPRPTTPRPTTPRPTTPSPSSRPSEQPSAMPLQVPTRATTPEPSQSLSNGDSAAPTESSRPTVRLSVHPTRMPSITPSALPSVNPTAAPSLQDQEFNIKLSIEMELREKLGLQTRNFELTVAETIKGSIAAEEDVQSLRISANVVEQGFTDVPNASRTRRLQLRTVKVSLVVRVIFKSSDMKVKADVEEMIGQAFNSEPKRQLFVDELTSRDEEFFGSAGDPKVEVEGVEPVEEGLNQDSDDGSGSSLIIIIVAAAGTVVVLLTLGLIVARRKGSKESVGGITPPEKEGESQSQGQTMTETKLAVSTEILVERQDDISTLGDPTFGMGGIMNTNSERDEQTASIGNDYDYTKQYLRAQGLASLEGSREFSRDRLGSGTSFEQTRTNSSNSGALKHNGLVTPSVFSDEASFERKFGEGGVEKRFEVQVPPGKLGMVIDTPNGGVPAVRAIKAESVLASKVKVGDRLVAVDYDDVTAMTTVQVSKLISLKSDQQRVLAFVTTRDIS